MQIATDAPRRQRAISDFIVSVPQPYIEGHTITAGEASALNQTIAENVSNNLRAKLKAGHTTGEGENAVTRPFTDEEAQVLVDNYLAEYEMGVRQTGSGTSRVVDPIEREARRLAKEAAKQLVTSKGKKLKEVDLDAITDAIYDANVDSLTAEATKIVKAKDKAGEKLADLGAAAAGLLDSASAEEAPAE